MRTAAVTFVALCLLTAGTRASDELVLRKVNDTTCLDGSTAGYYVTQAAGESSDWIVFLQGGGECVDDATCAGRLHTDLGSSANWPPSRGRPADITRASPFSDWNVLYVPYCTGDLHYGSRVTPSGLHFTGHSNLERILEDALNETAIGSADTVIISGESAGGLGCIQNTDYIADKLPSVSHVFSVPIAGFYFGQQIYDGPGHTSGGLPSFETQAFQKYAAEWGAVPHKQCAEAFGQDAWKCLMTANVVQYLRVPVFVVEAQTDQVVLMYHDQIPKDFQQYDQATKFVQSWSAVMKQALEVVENCPSCGYFNPACFIHTQFTSSQPTIGGKSYIDAVTKWISARKSGTSERVLVQDSCGIVCNPTCPQV